MNHEIKKVIFKFFAPTADQKAALDGLFQTTRSWTAESVQLNVQGTPAHVVALINVVMKNAGRAKVHTELISVVFQSEASVDLFPGLIKTSKGYILEVCPKNLKYGEIQRMYELLSTHTTNKKVRTNEPHYLHKGECYYAEDPTIALTKKRLLIRTDLRGRTVLSPALMELYLKIEDLWLKHVLTDFEEVRLPTSTSIDTLRTSGHVASFGNELHYLYTMTRDPAHFSSISNELKVRHQLFPQTLKAELQPVGAITYGQCEVLFPIFRRAHLNHAAFPLRIFDRSGPSMREEGRAIHGLSRLNEFYRIEAIWITKTQQVAALKQELLRRIRALFTLLKITFREVEVGSWTGCCGPGLGTIDFEMYLPYCDRWLEVLSFNLNGQRFLKRFEVRVDVPTTTGCFGLGKDRLVHALFSQFGFKPEVWPEILKPKIDSPRWYMAMDTYDGAHIPHESS